MGFEYDIQGLDFLKGYFQAAKATLPTQMKVTSMDVNAALVDILTELYPAAFIPRFTITNEVSETNADLAAVTLTTDNKVFYWYEFGTRHENPTYPVNKRMLYFESSIYGWVFRPETYYLTGQGIKPHHKLEELKPRFKAEAKARWKTGLAAFFNHA